MKKSLALLTTFLVSIFLLIGSPSFGSETAGYVDGPCGGWFGFESEYQVSDWYGWSDLEQYTEYYYEDFSVINGISINGTIVYTYMRNPSIQGYKTFKGNTTVNISGINYYIYMDITIRENGNKEGIFTINGMYCCVDDDIMDLIQLLYFKQTLLMCP